MGRYIRSLELHHELIESYAQKIEALRHMDTLELGDITIFCGENGSGKSTLMEAIAQHCGINAEGGTNNYMFSTFEEGESPLLEALYLNRSFERPRIAYFFRAESFYNVVTKREEYRLQQKSGDMESYHEMSHGEAFLRWMKQYSRDGLFLLDEPEAAFSYQRQLSLMLHIHACVKAGCQFIIATHSPLLMAIPGAKIYSFDDQLKEITYEESQSYQLLEMFINHRHQLLHHLFEEESE